MRKWSSISTAALFLTTAFIWPLAGQQVPPLVGGESPVETPKLPVEVLDPSPHLPGLPEWLVLLVILAICIPLIALFFFLLRKREPIVKGGQKTSPYEESRDALRALRDSDPETPLAELATRISIVLRHYLAQSRSDISRYQTREEFLTDEDRLRHVSEPLKSETVDFLNELGSLQYAPATSDPVRVTSLIDQALVKLQALASGEHSNNETNALLADD